MLFMKFCTELMFGLIKDQAGLLNQLSHNTYIPLVGSSYLDLPIELKHPRKGLINIKNNDQKCFLWCHVRDINPLKEYPERIKKIDRKIFCNLNFDGTEFPIEEKDFEKVEVQNNICINVFCYEN